jgi:uncharacterized protein (TIRG00374 family)
LRNSIDTCNKIKSIYKSTCKIKLTKFETIFVSKYINTQFWEKFQKGNFMATSAKTKKVFAVGFLIALVAWILYGISFLIIANSVGFTIEFFESVMAVMGANAIGNLPITVGGSGLAEFGIIAYINNLDPFNLVIPEEGLEWNAVIGWRIATYYVPIVVTWVLLVKLALGKYTRPETTQNECPVCRKILSDSEFASHLKKEHKTE